MIVKLINIAIVRDLYDLEPYFKKRRGVYYDEYYDKNKGLEPELKYG